MHGPLINSLIKPKHVSRNIKCDSMHIARKELSTLFRKRITIRLLGSKYLRAFLEIKCNDISVNIFISKDQYSQIYFKCISSSISSFY